MTRLPAPLRPLFPLVKRTVLTSTQALSPVTRRVPSPGTRLAPPRHMALSTEAYAASHREARITVDHVFGHIQLSWPTPPGEPPDHFVFAQHTGAVLAPSFVATIPYGRAVGPFGAVVTPDDTLLFDLSPYFGAEQPTQHPIFLRPRLAPVEPVEGTVAVLTTRAVDNYYHFLIDVLPRLELLRRAGVEVDRYIVNRHLPYQDELLERLGVPAARTLESRLHPHVRAERLVVPTLPDADLRTPPWPTAWLRQQLLPSDDAAPRRRLYVTRGQRRNSRRVNNEAAVLEALEPLGFESFDPGAHRVAEQIEAFAAAEVVVGPHGAGLTNIVFCRPGATVVELFAPDYVNVCYWNIASTVEGLRYRYLVNGQAPLRARFQRGVDSDITVDIPALLGIVEAALAGAPA